MEQKAFELIQEKLQAALNEQGFGEAVALEITDALEQMEKQNYGSAKETLITAQQKTEEIYMSAEP